ncbi:hypothetical protein DRN58_00570, partial [Thermococci archaeon]
PMIHYRTASIATLVTVQSAFPHWNVFPFFISAFAGLIALHGMMGEKPFDQVIAPHEIASGPMVEYSGKFLVSAIADARKAAGGIEVSGGEVRWRIK